MPAELHREAVAVFTRSVPALLDRAPLVAVFTRLVPATLLMLAAVLDRPATATLYRLVPAELHREAVAVFTRSVPALLDRAPLVAVFTRLVPATLLMLAALLD